MKDYLALYWRCPDCGRLHLTLLGYITIALAIVAATILIARLP